MRLFFFLLLFCTITIRLTAQKDTFYEALKARHQSVFQLHDSIIYFDAITKNRFKEDTINIQPHLYRIGKNQTLYDASIYWNNIWDKSGLYVKNFKRDTFIKSALFYYYDSIKRENITPSAFTWLYHYIPTFENDGYSKKTYNKPTYTYLPDMTIIEQQYKNDNRARLLYVNKQLQIAKMAYINYDTTEADEYWEFRFRYHNGQNYDSLAKAYKLGTYTKLRADVPLVYVPKKDTLSPAGYVIPMLGNKTLTIDSTKTGYILLDYWYFGCGPCMQMMPFMNSLDARADSTKFHVLGVNTADKSSDILRYFGKRGLSCHQMDCKAIKPFHDIHEHPTLILLDSKLNEVKRWVGYSPYQEKQIEKYLLSLGLIR
ncbi:MAG: TlpA disulfide reductase family protein [Bacteroidota bacterium]